VPGYPNHLRLPNLRHLQCRDLETDHVTDFEPVEFSLVNLDGFVRVLVYWAEMRRQLRRQLRLLPDSVSQNLPTTHDHKEELLYLQDNMRVSFQNGRLKERTVLCYQDHVVISRWKGSTLITVQRMEHSDLLQVNLHWTDGGKQFGVLRVFWKSMSGEGMTDAVFSPTDSARLTLWAAFLASAASKLPVAGSFESPHVLFISLFGFPYLEHIRDLQQLLGLLPLIKSKELDPYNDTSMSFHLIQLGRILSQLKSEMPSLQPPKQGGGGEKGDASLEEEDT
jgi:hypothetical protein